MNFFFSFLFLSIHRAQHPRMYGHQMYSGGSVVGKASTVIGIEISSIPPLIFTGGQKVRNLASFSTPLNFQPPTFEMQQDIRTLMKQTSCVCHDRPMSSPSLVKLGPRTPEYSRSVVPTP